MSKILLRYVGRGDFLLNAPARHLTDDDVADCPLSINDLLASGLYELSTEFENELLNDVSGMTVDDSEVNNGQ